MKYKGFTLLETMAYLDIYLLILFSNFNLLINVEKGYYKYINEHRINHEISQVNLTIDRLINEDATIVISDKKLLFYYNDDKTGRNRNELYVLKNKLIIAYYREYRLETINEILSDVNYMNLVEKDKVKYLIIDKEGQRYIKCLGTKRIKEIL